MLAVSYRPWRHLLSCSWYVGYVIVLFDFILMASIGHMNCLNMIAFFFIIYLNCFSCLVLSFITSWFWNTSTFIYSPVAYTRGPDGGRGWSRGWSFCKVGGIERGSPPGGSAEATVPLRNRPVSACCLYSAAHLLLHHRTMRPSNFQQHGSCSTEERSWTTEVNRSS